MHSDPPRSDFPASRVFQRLRTPCFASVVQRRAIGLRAVPNARHGTLLGVALLLSLGSVTLGSEVAAKPPSEPQPAASAEREPTARLDLAASVDWLRRKARQLVRRSRRSMHDGTAAFPPQVGSGYEAFWLRDYAYMLEGAIDSFRPDELRDACRLFLQAQADDGACVDCVKFDGTPIYKPGYGSMGENAVADGSPFTVDVAWHTWRRLKDRQLLDDMLPRLKRAMQAVPRNPKSGLVHIAVGDGWDRCPYGFTDTVRKQGDVLFCSLLTIQACRQMGDLCEAAEESEEATAWRRQARRLTLVVQKIFWDGKVGLFRAATARCGQHDIWGSAFAVYLGVATPEQARRIARYFKDHYDEIVDRGQLRHLPGGVYWERAGARDRYQNGGYWATPIGWFVVALDLVDPELADRTVIDMVHFFRTHGVAEWTFGEHVALPRYVASATLPLAGIDRMLARRNHAERTREPAR